MTVTTGFGCAARPWGVRVYNLDVSGPSDEVEKRALDNAMIPADQARHIP